MIQKQHLIDLFQQVLISRFRYEVPQVLCEQRGAQHGKRTDFGTLNCS